MQSIKKLASNKEFSVFIIVVVVMAILSFISPVFLTFENIIDILKTNVVLGICAMGMLFVIITGGIDVSIGAQLAAVTVVTGTIMVKFNISNPLICFAIGIAVGGIIGLLNGVMVAKLMLPPIIATLGTNSIINGLIKLYTNGAWINGIPEKWIQFGKTVFFGTVNENGIQIGLPIQLLFLLLAMILTWFILRRTLLGRGIMAMGGNAASAERLGLNTANLTMFSYAYLGLMAGLGAMTHQSIMKQVDPNAFLGGYEMNVIAAVVLGGASVAGGSGSMFGAFLGVFLFSIINNGLTLARIPTFWQKIVVGSIILLAVSIDMIKIKMDERNQTKVDIEEA